MQFFDLVDNLWFQVFKFLEIKKNLWFWVFGNFQRIDSFYEELAKNQQFRVEDFWPTSLNKYLETWLRFESNSSMKIWELWTGSVILLVHHQGKVYIYTLSLPTSSRLQKERTSQHWLSIATFNVQQHAKCGQYSWN